jgi:hypothetical protein
MRDYICTRFWKFHRDNPYVYKMLKKYSLDMRKKGIDRWGIGGLFEVLRWDVVMHTKDNSEYKLCNDYRAFYARLLIRQNSMLEGFFVLRESAADEMFEHPIALKLVNYGCAFE